MSNTPVHTVAVYHRAAGLQGGASDDLPTRPAGPAGGSTLETLPAAQRFERGPGSVRGGPGPGLELRYLFASFRSRLGGRLDSVCRCIQPAAAASSLGAGLFRGPLPASASASHRNLI